MTVQSWREFLVEELRRRDAVNATRPPRARLRFIVWTINDGSDLCALVGAGVDGIMTDDPGRLRSYCPALGPTRPLSGSPPPHHEPRRRGLTERCPRRLPASEGGGDSGDMVCLMRG